MSRKQKSLKIPNNIRKLDHKKPQQGIINKAADIIRQGGVIAFPTRYLYGLGANALNPQAVDRIFTIKRRPHNKPLLVLIDQTRHLDRLVRKVPSSAIRLMEHFWPGKITIVFEAEEELPVNLTAGTGRIGLRMPEHPIALALVKAVDIPITATSANITGRMGCSLISDLDVRIGEKLDLILDAGRLKGGIGSTVVDVTGDLPIIIREGVVPAEDVFSVLGPT